VLEQARDTAEEQGLFRGLRSRAGETPSKPSLASFVVPPSNEKDIRVSVRIPDERGTVTEPVAEGTEVPELEFVAPVILKLDSSSFEAAADKSAMTSRSFRVCFNPVSGALVVPTDTSRILTLPLHEEVHVRPREESKKLLDMLSLLIVEHASDSKGRLALASEYLETRASASAASDDVSGPPDLFKLLAVHDVAGAVEFCLAKKDYFLASAIAQSPVGSSVIRRLPSGQLLPSDSLERFKLKDEGLRLAYDLVFNGNFPAQQDWATNLGMLLWYRPGGPGHCDGNMILSLDGTPYASEAASSDIAYLVLQFSSYYFCPSKLTETLNCISALLRFSECDYELAYRILHFVENKCRLPVDDAIKSRVLISFACLFLAGKQGQTQSAISVIENELPNKEVAARLSKELRSRQLNADHYLDFGAMMSEKMYEEAHDVALLLHCPKLFLAGDYDELMASYLRPLHRRAADIPQWSTGCGLFFDYLTMMRDESSVSVAVTEEFASKLVLLYRRVHSSSARFRGQILPGSSADDLLLCLSHIATEVCKLGIRCVVRQRGPSNQQSAVQLHERLLMSLNRLSEVLPSDVQFGMLQNLLLSSTA
jgi:hypothetical protein